MPLQLLLTAAASQMPIPPAPVVPSAPATIQAIVDLQPSEAACDGVPIAAQTLAIPIPTVATLRVGQTIEPFSLTFRIDESGRPLGIAAAPRVPNGVWFLPTDLQPALAASRFASGGARSRCTIRYRATAHAIADAPLPLVFRYLALPHDRSFQDAAIAKRARDASPGCFGGKPPAVLLRGYPDFDAVPQPSGALSMTIVQFDIDPRGKPVRTRTAASDGNAALDAGARDAVQRSRFGKDARSGCTFPYYRRQSIPLAAPAPPPIADFRKPGGTCGEDEGSWQLPPRMTFPEAFRRRGIEGWAVIRYDVAPWGQTGNVTVLASEPAAIFGEQARGIIMSARRPQSATGATGCVDRVLFRLPEGMTEETAAPPAPIVD